ncbi:MAG TPA: HAD family hydrolase [Polyangiaceae bacterium]|nr:HAD family hydrolase [Polyangiaceae bacterium]
MDPLRAGHVALLEGRGFHYFCDALCKRDYLSASGRPQDEEVATAAPPEVEYVTQPPPSGTAPSSEARAPGRGPTSTNDAQAASSAPSDRGARPTLPSLDLHEAFELSRPPSIRPPDPPPEARGAPAPSAVRSIAERGIDRTTTLIDGAGIVAGVLAPAIGLLGVVADVARLPLVVFAWVALALRVQRVGHDPSDPHAYVVLAPTAGAVVAALWAHASGDPHAVAIAVLAGVSCAVAIAVETTVTRARAGVQGARERIERALDVRVRAVHGDDVISLPVIDVRPGEQAIVEAGEIVGVDAIVTAGEARVVPWLGADVEVMKREGDPVVAGARVLSNRLRMTTTWSGRERAWVKFFSSAASSSARIEVAAPTSRVLRHTVERGVPCAAVLVGLATFAAGAAPAEVLAAMAAAGMAFGAKALVSFAGLHLARAHIQALASGITYKDPRAFERAGSATIAVLSARGTVLLGEPEIVAVEPVGRRDPEEGDEVGRVLSLAAGAETASSHPFAAAILRAARTRAVRPDHVRNATVHAGLGVTALASTGERLVVGGRAIMLEEKIGVAVADGRVTELEAQGRSVLLVALGDRLLGLIALQDGLRTGARAAVQRLLDARIEPVLVSGEARDTCETIGRALDIEHVRPAVLPADRGPEVRALGEGGGVVAVVGHPLSDDGALGAADVAVAMGAAGSTPGEWAVALASDDVRDAAMSLALPHAARARVRVAIVLGATPSIIALLAVGFGVAPLAVAPLAAFLAAVAVAVHAREAT